MSTHDQSHELARRLFARFAAVYGSQKVAAMWADADLEVVRETWSAALSRFSEQSIRSALGDLIASGDDWPPTLPRFVELCRQAGNRREQSRPASALLPAPGDGFTDNETAQANLERIRTMLAGIGKAEA